MPHSEVCRKRLETAIAQTPQGAERIRRAQLRADRWTTEYLKKNPTPTPPAAQGENGDLSAPQELREELREEEPPPNILPPIGEAEEGEEAMGE